MSTHSEPFEDPQAAAGAESAAEQDTEQAPLSIETHGFKVSAPMGQAGPDPEDPRSLRDVGKIIKRHLLKLALVPTGLVVDSFGAVRSVLQGISGAARGTGKLPGAVADRIQDARVRVLDTEDRAQAKALEAAERAAQLPPGSREAAKALLAPTRDVSVVLGEINDKINELRSKGYDARCEQISENEFAIILVRDGAGNAAVELARYKLTESRPLPAAPNLDEPIAVLQLPSRDRVALDRLQIRTLRQLIRWFPYDLSTSLEADGMPHDDAEALVAVIRERLRQRRLDLTPDPPGL